MSEKKIENNLKYQVEKAEESLKQWPKWLAETSGSDSSQNTSQLQKKF